MSGEVPDGAYRCAQCRHGKHLSAWAQSNVHGRLLDDGTVEESYSDQHTLFEGSIQCDRHPDAELQRRVNGRWTRWLACVWAEGQFRCREGQKRYFDRDVGPCPCCEGRGGHDVPVSRRRSPCSDNVTA